MSGKTILIFEAKIFKYCDILNIEQCCDEEDGQRLKNSLAEALFELGFLVMIENIEDCLGFRSFFEAVATDDA